MLCGVENRHILYFAAVGAKAPAKVAITAILSGNGPKVRNHGNSYHPRETPGWQKPITFFMKQEAESSKDDSKDDEEMDEKPRTKRLKVETGGSNGDSDAENTEDEEEDGIPGIPASSSSNKVSGTNSIFHTACLVNETVKILVLVTDIFVIFTNKKNPKLQQKFAIVGTFVEKSVNTFVQSFFTERLRQVRVGQEN